MNLEQAFKHQQAGDLPNAIEGFEYILKSEPNNVDALHGLGLTKAMQRDFNGAIFYLSQAVQIAPQVPAFHNNLANALKANGEFDKAKQHYQESLRLKTPYPEAHNNLGSLYQLMGQTQLAILEFQKAIRERVDFLDAHYNLGNCFAAEEKLLEAKAHYDQVLKLRPEHLGAIYHLGITLTALKDFENAKPLLENTVKRESNNIEALFHLGLINATLGNTEKARKYYTKVIKLKDSHAFAHHNLATLLLSEDDKSKALEHYEKALCLMPNNQTAKHMIKALKGEQDSNGAPLEYIRALFDQYAPGYDKHLKEKLKYNVPSLLREAITPYLPNGANAWKVLDLGCGSGLVAPYFRDTAMWLIGVDLSPNMIEIAKSKGGYDKLYCDEMCDFLVKPEHAKQYDLIIAADVLIYSGELDSLFQNINKALKPGGYFSFSIEKTGVDRDYYLSESGRYQHSEKYITSLVSKYGFNVKHKQTKIIREHEDKTIEGGIFILEC